MREVIRTMGVFWGRGVGGLGGGVWEGGGFGRGGNPPNGPPPKN